MRKKKQKPKKPNLTLIYPTGKITILPTAKKGTKKGFKIVWNTEMFSNFFLTGGEPLKGPMSLKLA